jgi:hypothetical protein
MSIQDTLYLVTELNEFESLKVFLNADIPDTDIKTLGSENYPIRYVETPYYDIEAEKADDWIQSMVYEGHGIKPDIRLYIDYRQAHLREGSNEVLAKTARLLNELEGDMVLTSTTYAWMLIRKDGHIRIRAEAWTPDLRKLITLPHELVEVE